MSSVLILLIINILTKQISGKVQLLIRMSNKNMEQLEEDTEGVYKILSCMSIILKEPQELPVIKSDDEKSYLNFRFFKLMKYSLVIAVLSLLVFILTLFCMKQQNDYVLLMDEHYRQNIEIREMIAKIDNLKPKKGSKF